MKRAILADICDPTPAGELVPIYDRETGILTVGADGVTDYPHGININGELILDLANDFTLVNFDLIRPRTSWVKKDFVIFPSGGRRNLRLAAASVEQKNYQIDFDVWRSPDHRHVYILFGDEAQKPECYALSRTCNVLIHEGRLIGFQMVVDKS